MALSIKPSDLYYKYPRIKETRQQPKFSGKPDPHPFDREDQYEVIPMLDAVMDTLDSVDGDVLNRLEEVLINEMPGFIVSREEVFDYLVAVMSDILAQG
ncbi:MAG: hypothetical protein C0618_10015 [Desulfuromonas sp.]|nr:MAG: hypothetical protein C0618_10015 [Desulfuromonas sp.]